MARLEIPYGLRVKVISRTPRRDSKEGKKLLERGIDPKNAKQKSAVAAFAYRTGEQYLDERTNTPHDYTNRQPWIDRWEIMAPENAPDWVYDPAKLANAIELGEKRIDAQLIREAEGMLPRELTPEQQEKAVRNYAQKTFVDKGMIVLWSIHRPKAADGDDHPHVHFAQTMRNITPGGFAPKKNREWNDDFTVWKKIADLLKDGKEEEAKALNDARNIMDWRKGWADYLNDELEDAGAEGRVDHRTLEAQRAEALAKGNMAKAARLDRPAVPYVPMFAAVKRLGQRLNNFARSELSYWNVVRLKKMATEHLDTVTKRSAAERLHRVRGAIDKALSAAYGMPPPRDIAVEGIQVSKLKPARDRGGGIDF